MNNEPVAWAYIKDGDFFDAVHPDEHEKYEGMYTTPLYTHPVKELTDEEIMQIVWQQNILLGNDALKKFARAILRKAQEK